MMRKLDSGFVLRRFSTCYLEEGSIYDLYCCLHQPQALAVKNQVLIVILSAAKNQSPYLGLADWSTSLN